MESHRYRLLQAGILLGLGIFLLVKIFTGTLYFYINDRFLWLVALGAFVFLLLSLAVARRPLAHDHGHQQHEHDHEHDHAHGHSHTNRWTLLVVAIPLALGFLVPAKPLDSSALDNRGITTNAPLSLGSNQAQELERPSDQRSVLDWVRAFNYADDPQSLAGERAALIGFVYHDPRLGPNQFLVSRFTVTCCVADAFAVGVIVESEDAASWPGNTWVHVSGEIAVGRLDGNPAPLILAESIKEVAIPPQPYLFP